MRYFRIMQNDDATLFMQLFNKDGTFKKINDIEKLNKRHFEKMMELLKFDSDITPLEELFGRLENIMNIVETDCKDSQDATEVYSYDGTPSILSGAYCVQEYFAPTEFKKHIKIFFPQFKNMFRSEKL